MRNRPLSPTALIRVFARLRPLLAKADADRLDVLHALVGEDGRINLAALAAALFADKSQRDQLTFVRQFRKRLNTAAKDDRMVLECRQDGNTKAPAEERSVFFVGEDLAATGAEGLTAERTGDIQARVDSGELRTDQAAIPSNLIEVKVSNLIKVKVVVSYSHADEHLVEDLLDRLNARFRRDATYHYVVWRDDALLVGKEFDSAIHQRFRDCHIGLQMLSPDFAKSDYIRDNETPYFTIVGRHPVPISLRDCDLKAHPAMRRISQQHIFYGRQHWHFEKCPDDAAKDAFVAELHGRIGKLLAEHPPPPAPEPPDVRFDADLKARLAEQGLPWFEPSRGRPTGIAAGPAVDSAAEDALTFLQRWLDDPQAQPYAALLGDYGMGKTTTCRMLARRLLDRRRDGETARLPIYLDLRDLDRASRESGDLDRILTRLLERANRQGSANPLTPAELRNLVQQDGALLILDGLDEALTHLSPSDGNLFTRRLLECLPIDKTREVPAADGPRPGRLLVSCRTHYFPTLRDQASHLTVQGRETLHQEDFRGLILLPFTEEQILGYLRAALPDRDPETMLALLKSIHNLAEMVERPVTLSMLTREIERIEKLRESRVLTGAEIYRELVLSWMDRDDGKHQLRKEHKLLLMEQIAAELWRDRRTGWTAEEAETWLVLALDARPDLDAHYKGLDRSLLQLDLRNATCLVRVGDEFRFAHTSLQEYFLASFLKRALEEIRPEGWAMPTPSVATLDFLGQMLAGAAAALRGMEALRDRYRDFASHLFLAYAQQALAKGYPIVPLAGIRLEGAELRGLRLAAPEGAPPLNLARACFRGAALHEAVFRRVNLEGADLSGAALVRAEFNTCRLAKADFAAADLQGALFPDSPPDARNLAGARFARTRLFAGTALAAPPAIFVREDRARDGARPVWLDGHHGSVMSVAFSPDGARLASGSTDGTVRLWDAASGATLATLEGHGGGVMSVAFSPDGARLASGSADGTVRLWDAASGATLATLEPHRGSVRSVAFSPDGARLASGSTDGTVRLWDAASGATLATLEGHGRAVNSVAFSPDGARLASGSDDGMVRLWDAASGATLATLEGHGGLVISVAFSPDGARLASGSTDGTVRLWDAASGATLATLEGHGGGVMSVAFSPDGARLASGSADGTVRLWDAASGATLATLEPHRGSVRSVAFSPDGARLASGSTDGTVRLWDAASGATLATLEGHGRAVNSVAFSPDGARLASGSDDGMVRLWDAASGATLATLEGHGGGVRSVAFSPDGARLASGSHDGTVRLWDAASGATLATLEGHGAGVMSVAFSPDGARLASGSHDGTVRLWDAASGATLATLEGHGGSVMSVAFSPDGARLASGSADGTARLWDAASGATLATLEGHRDWVNSVAFSPDGARLASGSDDGTVRLWDAASGATLATLEGHRDWVRSVAFSPDGARLASGSTDGTVRLWDAASGATLATLEGHGGGVISVAFSRDGARLASGSADGTVRLWDAASGATLATLEGHGGWVNSVAFSPDGARFALGSHDGTVRLWDAAAFTCVLVIRSVAGAHASFDGSGELLAQGGEAWRYLHWQRHDEAGRLETWPWECFRWPDAA